MNPLLFLAAPALACTACMGSVEAAQGFFGGLWWGIVLLLGTTMTLVAGIVWAIRSVEKSREKAEAEA